jgi:IS605 OrfB family transposase
LQLLQAKLHRLEQEAARPVPRITFGSNQLFRAQFNLEANGFASQAEWQAEWEAARANQFVCVGSKDETGGNQSCTYFHATHTLRLRLPHALIAANGGDKYLNIADVAFRYGQAVIKAALTARGGQALTFRFIRRAAKTRKGYKKTTPAGSSSYVWYVQVTTEREATPKVTERRLGAIGLDLNPALLAIATLDRYGNPISSEHFPVQLHKRSSEQVEATLADVVADVVLQARTQHLPIVIERLDFTQKKNELREKSNGYARMLSAFAYRKFYDLIYARASREGVEIIEVNPAFTSVIGTVKFKSGYGLSSHAAAAVAIARRGLFFKEATRTRAKPVEAANSGVDNKTKPNQALSVPVRIRHKHLWSSWRVIAHLLRGLKHQLYLERSGGSKRPLSERTTGGSLIELSFQHRHGTARSYALWL